MSSSKPIFLIGCPRSGTTITLKIMACHEHLAWVSNFVNDNPKRLHFSLLNRVFDLPIVGSRFYLSKTQKKYYSPLVWGLPTPMEPWNFWNAHLKFFEWERGGSTPPRRHTKHDLGEDEANNLKKSIHTICRYQGKSRFLSKYTDLPRINYLTHVFPDALFIHIIRDGRAVAASYSKKTVQGSFGGWKEREWWMRGWPSVWRKQFLENYNDQVSFAAYMWKFFVNEILEDAKTIDKGRYMEVRYQDIIYSPHTTFQGIFDFCGLRMSENVSYYLDKIGLSDMNQKWQQDLTENEKQQIDTIIHEPELRYFFDDKLS